MPRQSEYTDEIGEAICQAISEGATTIQAAESVGISAGTLFKWLHAHPSFDEQYTRARECRGERFAERVIACADQVTNENTNAVRVKLDAMKWAASHFAPKRYSDRAAVELSGTDGGPVTMALVVRDVGAKSSEDSEK